MRSVQTIGAATIAALTMIGFSGCVATGPLRMEDSSSIYEPGSDEWWAEKAALPVGERQKIKKGKLWPPRPRPTGPKQQFSHVYHAAHFWPYPYICQDRAYVHGVLNQQISNGWADETTLYHYHFDAQTHELTEPGRLHLNWILVEAPDQFRQVHIQKVGDDQTNQARLAAVQNAMNEIVIDGSVAPITWRAGLPPTRPAHEVQRMQLLDRNSLRAPVIGSSSGGGSGGSGGGSGGSSGGSSGASSSGSPTP